jgi:hypothetical protein
MTPEQREALRKARGAMSVREFKSFLVTSGLSEQVSRQRLGEAEKGSATLTQKELDAIADALVSGGRGEDVVALLRMHADEPAIVPAPPSTPPLRRRQWTAVAERIPQSRWWLQYGALVSRLGGTNSVLQYRRLLAEHGIDPESQLAEVARRLRLEPGRQPGAHPGDAVRLESPSDDLFVRLDRGRLFVIRVVLRNTGLVPWRDRFLYRLGPPVTSSMPFVIILVPVPDTLPGDACELLIPGRAQWFLNLAVVSFCMTLSDCTPCLPGRLQFFVDTRVLGGYDHTLRLPEGYSGRE